MRSSVGVFSSVTNIDVLLQTIVASQLKIAAVWNKSAKEAARIAHRFHVPFATNQIDEVLLRKDVDLVFVFTPPNLHAEISVKALSIGKHVVCDAPAGLSQCDSLKMVVAAQYYPSLISIINYPFRFMHIFRQLKQHLARHATDLDPVLININIGCGSLIDCDRYDWTCDRYTGGGILTLVASHYIDLVRFLTGKKCSKATGTLKTFMHSKSSVNDIRNITAADFCTFQLECDNQLFVNATFTSHYPKQQFNQDLCVSFANGSYFAVRNDKLYGADECAPTETLLFHDSELVSANADSTKSAISSFLTLGWQNMVNCLKDAFGDAGENTGWNKDMVLAAANFDDAQHVQAVIEAIKRSSKSNEWETVSISSAVKQQPDSVATSSSLG